MIVKITGKLVALFDERAVLEAPPFEYETFISEFTRRQLQSKLQQNISLFTIEYLDGNPAQGRLTPKLLGFLYEIEREFFEIFCSVDGLGAKKALRAMVRPAREIADMIEKQDVKSLSSLPGIGAATAERIVAKLRRKMSKFALIAPRDSDALASDPQTVDVVSETFQALVSIGHSETEARKHIETALAQSKKKFKDSTELFNAIYAHINGK